MHITISVQDISNDGANAAPEAGKKMYGILRPLFLHRFDEVNLMQKGSG